MFANSKNRTALRRLRMLGVMIASLCLAGLLRAEGEGSTSNAAKGPERVAFELLPFEATAQEIAALGLADPNRSFDERDINELKSRINFWGRSTVSIVAGQLITTTLGRRVKDARGKLVVVGLSLEIQVEVSQEGVEGQFLPSYHWLEEDGKVSRAIFGDATQTKLDSHNCHFCGVVQKGDERTMVIVLARVREVQLP